MAGSLDDLKKARSRQAWGEVRTKFLALQPLLPDSARGLILGECELEEGNYAAARTAIESVLKHDPLNQEALILMGRTEYGSGRLNEALNFFKKVKLLRRSDDKEFTKIVPDEAAFFLKGMIVYAECLMLTDSLQAAHDILEQAQEFARHHVVLDRIFPTDPVKRCVAWAAVEIQYGMARLQLMRNEPPRVWLQSFRECLRYAPELPSALRALCARAFGQALVRHCSDGEYVPRDAQHAGPGGVQVPRSAREEAVLLLLLAERELAADFGEVDFSCCATVTTPPVSQCADLALALGREEQYTALLDVAEVALAARFQDAHLLTTYGSALLCAREYRRGAMVLEQCLGLPLPLAQDVGAAAADAAALERGTARLLLARTYLNHLDRPGDAARYARYCLASSACAPLAAQAHHVVGVASSHIALAVRVAPERRRLQRSALRHLHAAAASAWGASDHNVLRNLALVYADVRDIDAALSAARASLEADRTSAASWHVLAALLSARKDYRGAVAACDAGLAENPDDVELAITRADLLEKDSGRSALEAYEDVVRMWRRVATAHGRGQQATTPDMVTPATSETARETATASQTRSATARLAVVPMARRGSRQLRRTAIRRMAVSEAHHSQFLIAPDAASTLAPGSGGGGGGASSYTGAAFADSPLATGFLAAVGGEGAGPLSDEQAVLWRNIAGVFMRLGQFDSATRCLEEARVCRPVECDTIFMFGLLYELQGEDERASAEYYKVLAVEAHHGPALLRLGAALLRTGDHVRAHAHFEAAVAVDPASHDAWLGLGRVMQARGMAEDAAAHVLTALMLETAAPAVPFSYFERIA